MTVLMMFLHIVDDFYLQGLLINMKQKSWWRNQKEYNEMYAHDYIEALFIHSFSWAFMIMLPLLIVYGDSVGYRIVLVINMIIHMIVDDLKANKKKINLVTDQTIHILQIVITSWVFALMY